MYQTSNEDIQRTFDKNARLYDRWMVLFERYVARGARTWAVSRARGSVLEIGAGSGLNFPLYGGGVEHVTAIELSGKMLALARLRLEELQIPRIDVRQGDVQVLDLPSGTADTVISTFTFCTIPDPLAASREAFRVLRQGGIFVLAEHGRSTLPVGRAIMRALEPLWIRISADHINRDPVEYLAAAGFTVSEVQRSGPGGIVFRIVAEKPATPRA